MGRVLPLNLKTTMLMMMKLNLFEDGGLAGAGGSRENEASLSVQTASYCRNLSDDGSL